MICKCGDTGIYNEVSGQGFYYCRSCKIEIELIIQEKQPMTQDEIDELFNPRPVADLYLGMWQSYYPSKS